MITESTAVFTGTELLVRAGRCDLAIAEFQRFVHEQPDDRATAGLVADLLVRAGDTAAGEGRCTEALEYLSIVANWRVALGDRAGAAELRARIDRLEVADTEAQLEQARTGTAAVQLRAARARACVAQGDAVGAAEHLTADMADGDPWLLLTIAEIHLRAGHLDRGLALVERAIGHDPSLANPVARLSLDVGARQPDAGFLLAEMAAHVWTTRSRWRAAASVFEDFVAQVPGYAPALVRLRDIEAAASVPSGEKRVLPFLPPAS